MPHDKVTTVIFKKDEIVFKEGDAAGAIYLVYSGSFEIFVERGGKDVVLSSAGPRQLFGEMAIIDGKPRSAGVRAVTDSVCYKISRDEFETHVAGMEPVMQAVFRTMVGIIRRQNEELAKLRNN